MNWQFKKPKYKNTRTTRDGYKFDSKMEAARYDELKMLKLSGVVMHIDIHPIFRLTPDTTYKADFLVYYYGGKIEVEDVKGFVTKDFAKKEKLFNKIHPLAPLKVIKKVRQ